MAAAVVVPSAGNIGGGGFIVYHGADGEVTAFNFREKAPLVSTRQMYVGEDGDVLKIPSPWEENSGELEDEANHEGILSVGVPGTVAGLYLAHQRLGSMEWSELLEPAVRLARTARSPAAGREPPVAFRSPAPPAPYSRTSADRRCRPVRSPRPPTTASARGRSGAARRFRRPGCGLDPPGCCRAR